jgi:hypothetical protein
MHIEPVIEELPAEFDAFRAEARAEDHHVLDRLANDWESGAMRFSQTGETFLAAYSGDRLAGVGGLMVDPVVPGALRMRRFYVLVCDPESRLCRKDLPELLARPRHGRCGAGEFSDYVEASQPTQRR